MEGFLTEEQKKELLSELRLEKNRKYTGFFGHLTFPPLVGEFSLKISVLQAFGGK